MNVLKRSFHFERSGPNDVVECLRPWYTTTYLLGISPYRLSSDGSTKLPITQLTKLGILRVLCVLSGIVYSFLGSFVSTAPKKNINAIISAADYAINEIVSISIYFIHMIRIKKLCVILHRITKIDESLQTVGVFIALRKYKTNLIWQIVCFFFYLPTIQLVSYIAKIIANTQSTSYSTKMILLLLNHNLLFAIKMLFVIKIRVILSMIKNCFGNINETILSLSHNTAWKTDEASNEFIENERKGKTHKPCSLQQKCYKLRKMHDELCEISASINSVIDIQTVSGITSCGVLIITNIFYLYNTWYNGQAIGLQLYRTLILLLEAIVEGFSLIPLFSKVSIEANNTGVIVHKVLGEVHDPKCNEQLQLFSSQLLHRKVQFSGSGLFPLDNSLIYSVVGTITSYLVILIQFQNISSPNSNSTGFSM